MIIKEITPGIFNWVDETAIQPLPLPAAGCPYFGEPTGERLLCPTCKGHVEVKVHSCSLFGDCVPGREIPGRRSCIGCKRAPQAEKTTMVKFPVVFRGDAYRNSAIFEQDGRLRILLRIGWGSAGLAVQDLDADLQPAGKPMPLWAEHPRASDAQEDPRVFWHHNRVHVAFVGVMQQKPMVVNVLYARLDQAGMKVEDTFAPHYQERALWEKNWEFFSHDGQLYAVYSIAPTHRVLKILDGELTEVAFDTEWAPSWKRGAMRGGASPVLVGDEYWCWFHGVEDFPGRNPKRVYTAGVYTFSARPPFKPLRCTPYPVLEASLDDRNGLDISVVYPCGAVLRDGKWLLSYGYHDREVRISEFDHGLIDRALR